MEDFLIKKIQEITFSVVSKDDLLWNTGILDSITMVEFATEIENEYHINIPFDDIIEENFKNVATIIEYIKKHQQ